MTDTCIILTTCASEEVAKAIAEALVGQSLAACVTVISNANTFYAYEGMTRWDEEFQLLIYTTVERFDSVAQAIQRIHTYDIPEILLVKVDQGSEASLGRIRRMGRP